MGAPEAELPKFCRQSGAGCLVTDFDPLRLKRQWKEAVAKRLATPFFEVDAHNIVPCWVASNKQEYGAYTLRPKIRRTLPEFLDEFPSLHQQQGSWGEPSTPIDWQGILAGLSVDRSVSEVGLLKPGERSAWDLFNDFQENKLSHYGEWRNDPLREGQSNLSPYLHFGQIAAQRVALEVEDSPAGQKQKRPSWRNSIIRRELIRQFLLL